MCVYYNDSRLHDRQFIYTDFFKGYVLEASPLPRLPVASLQPVTKPQDSFYADLNHQSREEEAINGTKGMIQFTGNKARYPVVLLLDGIVSSCR